MTATLQPESKSPSRRALLAGALASVGALAASVISRASPVRGADGGSVIIGADNSATSITTLLNSVGTGLVVEGRGSGWGISGRSTSNEGVAGISKSGAGVHGTSDSNFGVKGNSNSNVGVFGTSVSDGGVVGTSDSAAGVAGTSNSNNGVEGVSTSSVGVRGSSNSYFGVYGDSGSSVAVYGYSGATNHPGAVGQSAGNSTGVQGYSGGSLPAAVAKTGVYGYAAQDASSVGVRGESPAGFGIYGKTTGTGFAGYFNGKTFMSQFVEIAEMSTPAAPGANRARLFVRDSGGKTQLCVRFHTGAVKALAIEP